MVFFNQESLPFVSLSSDVSSHPSWYFPLAPSFSVIKPFNVSCNAMQVMKHQTLDLTWWPYAPLAESHGHPS
jgi:hypothetical protein